MTQSRVELRLRPGERWYVVQYLAHKEKTASFNLKVQGFRIFFPQVVKTVRHARKIVDKRIALFPGYMFVVLDPARSQWRSINGTFGVARLITIDHRPTPTPPGFVESIIDSLDQGNNFRMNKGFKPGQSVRVINGPFTSIIGHITSLDDKGRARVLLQIMSGEVVTSLSSNSLEAVDALVFR